MFRMGGSAGTGITSGLDRPGYKEGTWFNPQHNFFQQHKETFEKI